MSRVPRLRRSATCGLTPARARDACGLTPAGVHRRYIFRLHRLRCPANVRGRRFEPHWFGLDASGLQVDAGADARRRRFEQRQAQSSLRSRLPCARGARLRNRSRSLHWFGAEPGSWRQHCGNPAPAGSSVASCRRLLRRRRRRRRNAWRWLWHWDRCSRWWRRCRPTRSGRCRRLFSPGLPDWRRSQWWSRRRSHPLNMFFPLIEQLSPFRLRPSPPSRCPLCRFLWDDGRLATCGLTPASARAACGLTPAGAHRPTQRGLFGFWCRSTTCGLTPARIRAACGLTPAGAHRLTRGHRTRLDTRSGAACGLTPAGNLRLGRGSFPFSFCEELRLLRGEIVGHLLRDLRLHLGRHRWDLGE